MILLDFLPKYCQDATWEYPKYIQDATWEHSQVTSWLHLGAFPSTEIRYLELPPVQVPNFDTWDFLSRAARLLKWIL